MNEEEAKNDSPILMPSPPFREGTKLTPTEFAFVLNSGGIGDYINWTPAIRYSIKEHPHLFGRIISPSYFASLAELWFADLAPRFTVEIADKLEDCDYLKRTPSIVPNKEQYANACGFNLLQLGFVFYRQHINIPAGEGFLPVIKGDEADLSRFFLPREYVVLTPYATADNRRLPAAVFNSLIDWLKRRKLTPVLLGKKEITEGYNAKTDGELKIDETFDLREKTTLTEAACIMARAQATVGIDNGLLHLASCSDAPVLWAFSSVDPALRLTKRRNGALSGVIVPPESLSCRFCNSKMRFILGHDFKDCIYKGQQENLCVTMLRGEDLIKPLDELLKKSEERKWKLNSTSPFHARRT